MQVDLFVLVVVLALENLDAAVLDFINQPVFLVNFTALPASQIPLQGLRVAKPRIAVAVNVGKQLVQFFNEFLVLGLPVQILLPGQLIEDNLAHFSIAFNSSQVFVTKCSWPTSSRRFSSSRWRRLASL